MKIRDPFRILWGRKVICTWVTVWGIGTLVLLPIAFELSVLVCAAVFMVTYGIGYYLVFEKMPAKEYRWRQALERLDNARVIRKLKKQEIESNIRLAKELAERDKQRRIAFRKKL